jgi:serine/threonine-protein kinase
VNTAADGVVCRGLARDPQYRFKTAREFALAIEQTIGLASPSEVGEWVESVAADELARRQASIAQIEASSLGGDPRIALGGGGPAEVPSQVSSISVSRPAISVTTTKRGSSKVFFAIAAVLALGGVGLGGFAMKDSVLGNGRGGEPNRYERDARTFAMQRPTTVSGMKSTPTPVVRVAAPQPPPPAPPKVDNSKKCDPPYIIDPATGRRKYKMECLK